MRLLKPVERGLAPGRRIGRRVHQGFTLIELMIVVAIIGILASIAIPQYQRYTGKAQLTEALNIASGRKAGIGELLQNGVPLDAIDGATNGVPADVTANAGKYVVSLSVLDGTIVAVMNSTTVSPCVVGAVLTLEPVVTANPLQPIQWLCKSDAVCKPNTCI